MAVAEQAVILAAGRGTRLQKPDPSVVLAPEVEVIARQGIKALIPICGRPYLDYGLDRLTAAGIRRVCLIVAPDAGPLEEYIAHVLERFPTLHIETVIQPAPLGTAHALRFAEPATGGGEFLMLNSDNLYPLSALREAAAAPAGASYAIGFEEQALIAHSNFDASRVSRLGVLVPRPEEPDLLGQVVEKPEDPSRFYHDGRLWISMNLWRFTPAIYRFCETLAPSPRGEYEITSAVQELMDSGSPVRMLRCSDGVLDLTSRADIHHLESILCG